MLALALVVVACTGGPTAAPPLPSPGASTVPSSPANSVAPASIIIPTPPPGSPAAGVPACLASELAARITGWDNGAGHRFAHVQVTNTGAGVCSMARLDRPQLVDGHGSVLIDGDVPAASADLTLAPGAVLSADVDVSNYCGPDPLAPVSVAFVFPDGSGRFAATPTSPTDTSGVPPCFGPPGSAGLITTTGWVA